MSLKEEFERIYVILQFIFCIWFPIFVKQFHFWCLKWIYYQSDYYNGKENFWFENERIKIKSLKCIIPIKHKYHDNSNYVGMHSFQLSDKLTKKIINEWKQNPIQEFGTSRMDVQSFELDLNYLNEIISKEEQKIVGEYLVDIEQNEISREIKKYDLDLKLNFALEISYQVYYKEPTIVGKLFGNVDPENYKFVYSSQSEQQILFPPKLQQKDLNSRYKLKTIQDVELYNAIMKMIKPEKYEVNGDEYECEYESYDWITFTDQKIEIYDKKSLMQILKKFAGPYINQPFGSQPESVIGEYILPYYVPLYTDLDMKNPNYDAELVLKMKSALSVLFAEFRIQKDCFVPF